ncbi:MAG: hypothetical protein QNJ70_06625 [Xenococcaceae cyanobacterium MO_207.B15]|nr:hypothetical protein [Xenococcaceae cyanobacterium MO_207.B15]MDJ0742350.1 hypothetical protein [Xenococcaceae cyanobacterium MO_167.B27]
MAVQTSVINIQHSLQKENFSLLITSKFNGWLSGLWQKSTQDYQIKITFDLITIADCISRLKKYANITKPLLSI